MAPTILERISAHPEMAYQFYIAQHPELSLKQRNELRYTFLTLGDKLLAVANLHQYCGPGHRKYRKYTPPPEPKLFD